MNVDLTGPLVCRLRTRMLLRQLMVLALCLILFDEMS